MRNIKKIKTAIQQNKPQRYEGIIQSGQSSQKLMQLIVMSGGHIYKKDAYYINANQITIRKTIERLVKEGIIDEKVNSKQIKLLHVRHWDSMEDNIKEKIFSGCSSYKPERIQITTDSVLYRKTTRAITLAILDRAGIQFTENYNKQYRIEEDELLDPFFVNTVDLVRQFELVDRAQTEKEKISYNKIKSYGLSISKAGLYAIYNFRDAELSNKDFADETKMFEIIDTVQRTWFPYSEKILSNRKSKTKTDRYNLFITRSAIFFTNNYTGVALATVTKQQKKDSKGRLIIDTSSGIYNLDGYEHKYIIPYPRRTDDDFTSMMKTTSALLEMLQIPNWHYKLTSLFIEDKDRLEDGVKEARGADGEENGILVTCLTDLDIKRVRNLRADITSHGTKAKIYAYDFQREFLEECFKEQLKNRDVEIYTYAPNDILEEFFRQNGKTHYEIEGEESETQNNNIQEEAEDNYSLEL